MANAETQSQLKELQTYARSIAVFGWALVIYAGYALLGVPGVALALGLPMMLLGWSLGTKTIEAEALTSQDQR